MAKESDLTIMADTDWIEIIHQDTKVGFEVVKGKPELRYFSIPPANSVLDQINSLRMLLGQLNNCLLDRYTQEINNRFLEISLGDFDG